MLLFLLKILGEKEIEGLTDTSIPKRLGPKRTSKIRKLFNLSKNDDVRKYVIRRILPQKNGMNWVLVFLVYKICICKTCDINSWINSQYFR